MTCLQSRTSISYTSLIPEPERAYVSTTRFKLNCLGILSTSDPVMKVREYHGPQWLDSDMYVSPLGSNVQVVPF